jgi:predicted dehydrogenase
MSQPMPLSETLRVLVLGTGSIAQRHARVIRAFWPQADCRHWSHAVPVSSGDAAELPLYTWEAVRSFAPQWGIVCTPAPTHCKLTARLLHEVGCHVLVEKPLDVEVGRVAEVQAAAASARACVRVGYNLRHSSLTLALRQRVAQQQLGRVLAVRCEVGQDLRTWRPGKDYRASVSARRSLGGGVLNELSHEIDLLQWMFGTPAWASAHLGHHSDLEIDVEDQALLWLAFPQDGRVTPMVASVALDFFRQDPTRTCQVVCEQGSFRLDFLARRLEMRRAGQSDWSLLVETPPDSDATYAAQWRAFVATASGEVSDCCTLEEASDVVRTIHMARQSHETGGPRVVWGGRRGGVS